MNVGRYRLIAEIGHGGMAEVFLALAGGPAGFTKLVVIKQIRPNLASEPEFLSMFLDEARLAARLSHPNVVQTNEVGQDGERHFIAMEYLDGQPVSRILARDGGLPLDMHLRVLVDALAGLHHAHELTDYDGTPLHVVHRDASPQNLFVTYDGQVKVVDFGIAKAMSSSTETATGILKGKIAYMSPEQARGEPVDRRCDVFAVGVMMWEALTGRRLWKGVSDVAILQRLISKEDLPSPRSVAPEVDDQLGSICVKAMSRRREDRYATAAEMQAAIEAVATWVEPRDLGKLMRVRFEADRARIKGVIELAVRAGAAEAGATALAVLPSLDSPSKSSLSMAGQISVVAPLEAAAPPREEVRPPPPPREEVRPPAPPRGEVRPPALPREEVRPPAPPREEVRPPALPRGEVRASAGAGESVRPPAPAGESVPPPALPRASGRPPGAPPAMTAAIPAASPPRTSISVPPRSMPPPSGRPSGVPPSRSTWPVGSVVRTRSVVLGFGGAVVVLAALSAFTRDPVRSMEATGPRGPADAGEVAQVMLSIDVTPVEARLFLDDHALPANPFRASLAREAGFHVLRAEARGWKPLHKTITLDANLTLELTLRPEEPALASQASADAGVDASADAGVDASADAAVDASADAAVDAAASADAGRPRRGRIVEEVLEDDDPPRVEEAFHPPVTLQQEPKAPAAYPGTVPAGTGLPAPYPSTVPAGTASPTRETVVDQGGRMN